MGVESAQKRVSQASRSRTTETIKKHGVPEGYKGRPLSGDEIRAELDRRKAERTIKSKKRNEKNG